MFEDTLQFSVTHYLSPQLYFWLSSRIEGWRKKREEKCFVLFCFCLWGGLFCWPVKGVENVFLEPNMKGGYIGFPHWYSTLLFVCFLCGLVSYLVVISLLLRFIDDTFDEDQQPTIGKQKTKCAGLSLSLSLCLSIQRISNICAIRVGWTSWLGVLMVVI